jgi:hypothetical protein
MIKLVTKSHSLIGSLSRESQSLRLRCQKISNSTMNCNNKDLLSRLNRELSSLEKRRVEILKIASLLSNSEGIDKLTIEFLIEICSRPIAL